MAGPKRGRTSTLYVQQEGETPTWVRVGGRLDGTFTITTSTLPATNADSGRWEEHLEGDTGGTMSGSFHYLPDDPGQMALFAAKFAGQQLVIKWAPVDEANGLAYKAEAIITSLAHAAPHADLQTVNFDFQLTGEITEDTIA